MPFDGGSFGRPKTGATHKPQGGFGATTKPQGGFGTGGFGTGKKPKSNQDRYLYAINQGVGGPTTPNAPTRVPAPPGHEVMGFQEIAPQPGPQYRMGIPTPTGTPAPNPVIDTTPPPGWQGQEMRAATPGDNLSPENEEDRIRRMMEGYFAQRDGARPEFDPRRDGPRAQTAEINNAEMERRRAMQTEHPHQLLPNRPSQQRPKTREEIMRELEDIRRARPQQQQPLTSLQRHAAALDYTRRAFGF